MGDYKVQNCIDANWTPMRRDVSLNVSFEKYTFILST